jgi:rhodanese-related sulfurtransferase
VSKLIERAQVERMMAEGAQIIEVLPAKEFAEDHLPGAVSHPLRQLEKEAGAIDRNSPIVVYCWDVS